MRICLCFAHYPEAQCFLEAYSMKEKKDFEERGLPTKSHYFEAPLGSTSELSVLVTGEGLHAAQNALACLLSQESKIDAVHNLGLAASLDPKIPLNSIQNVSTCYGLGHETPYFKSFLSAKNERGLNCLSTEKRIQSEQEHNAYLSVADIIDRESWALAYVCSGWKIPFFATKIISDYANEKIACSDIHENAKTYSRKLLNYYQKEFALNSSKTEKSSQNTQSVEYFLNHPSFHFTRSSREKFLKLWKALINWHPNLKERILENTKDLKPKKLSPKENALQVIQDLEDLLYPEKKLFTEKAREICKDLQENNISYQWDDSLEENYLKVSKTLRTPKDLSKLLKGLELLDFEAFLSHFKGS